MYGGVSVCVYGDMNVWGCECIECVYEDMNVWGCECVCVWGHECMGV